MTDMYTYHIWLYKLYKFESLSLIYTIYESNDKLKALLDVMVNKVDLKIKTDISAKVKENYAKIEEANKILDLYKRPYLFIEKKKKKIKKGKK